MSWQNFLRVTCVRPFTSGRILIPNVLSSRQEYYRLTRKPLGGNKETMCKYLISHVFRFIKPQKNNL